MNRIRIAILLSLYCASPVGAADKDRHLFILSGQSNMARLDPDVSFTPTLVKAFGKENVVVVKDARTGQPIRRWYKKWKPSKGDATAATGDLYDRLMEKVRAAMKADEFATVTFIWMQGERDAREAHGDVYAAALRGLIARVSEDLERTDIHLVVGRLSDFDLADRRYPHWTKVRNALVEVAEAHPRGSWVDTDDLNDGENDRGKRIENDLHYTARGYEILGRRFAEKSIELIKNRAHEGN
ncbi:MAG: sialate O-acetylesterase [Isosphaeraceae bacterium]|nr:sialate O-acetylesterase [Isosphaeraceae bacterium]